MTKAESDSCAGKVEEKLQEVTASLAADIEISVDASSKSDAIFATKTSNALIAGFSRRTNMGNVPSGVSG